MDPSLESSFFEVALGTSNHLYLCFDDKLSPIITSKLASNSEGLFTIEGDLSEWDGHMIFINNLSSMILVKNHVTLAEAAHYVPYIALVELCAVQTY